MQLGSVIVFNAARGFAIIIGDDDNEYICHLHVPGTNWAALALGTRVEFEVDLRPRTTGRRPIAIGVREAV